MGSWTIYEFKDNRGRSIVRAWLEGERVPKEQVAALRAKLDLLRQGGPNMTPGLIFGPIKKQNGVPKKINDIYKMKFRGNKGWVQLRPFMCYGPFPDEERVITILLGAVEKDGKLEPVNHLERANENREALLNDPTRRGILRIPRDVEAGSTF